ncbi:hypothetical protein Q6A49_08860 [Pseudomonas sp. 22-AL-CL-001]|uniref:hypothetical protein n=1 Tax=Pseudomonas alabamensis TaxID=3064349 RepID=UPI002713BC2F|nr:hypothetical protein [Pseudomonas sp. 22-AL-CL-001]MDO7910639.1 hypothetical protein [Pseudomonas sp. 22-AL-CL-001]
MGAWLAGDDIPSTSGSIHPVTLVKAQRLATCRLSLVVDRWVATDDLPAIDRIKEIHKRLSSTPLVMYGSSSVEQARRVVCDPEDVKGAW